MLLTFKCLIGQAPVYLQDMVERYMPNKTLRSSNAQLLKVPRFKNKTLGARTFAYAAASLWNSLPLEIRATDNTDSFKSSLKTHLSKLAYDIMRYYAIGFKFCKVYRILYHSYAL